MQVTFAQAGVSRGSFDFCQLEALHEIFPGVTEAGAEPVVEYLLPWHFTASDR